VYENHTKLKDLKKEKFVFGLISGVYFYPL